MRIHEEKSKGKTRELKESPWTTETLLRRRKPNLATRNFEATTTKTIFATKNQPCPFPLLIIMLARQTRSDDSYGKREKRESGEALSVGRFFLYVRCIYIHLLYT